MPSRWGTTRFGVSRFTVGVGGGTGRDTLANIWQWMTAITADNGADTFTPLLGPPLASTPGDDREAGLAWELGNDDSSYTDFLYVLDFWNVHHPGVAFELFDPIIGERRVYLIDSDLNHRYVGADSFGWRFRITEAFPFGAI